VAETVTAEIAGASNGNQPTLILSIP
jgi:hypothetical protein